MESVGAKLKKARQEKNLTLEEVYQKTKIHLNTLKALEEDNFKAVGSYTKGFLKLYAKFLGLNLNEIMNAYEKAVPSQIARPIKIMTQETKDKPQSQQQTLKLRPSFWPLAIKIFIVLIILIITFSLIMFLALKLKRKAATKDKKDMASLRSNTTPKKIPSKINLILRAKEDTWIQLAVDNDIVFRNVLKKGQVETWTAKEKAQLSVGNAGGLVLEVNGKLISPLGRRGQVIKHIQITRESITIPR